MSTFSYIGGVAFLICGFVFLFLGGIEGIPLIGIGALLLVGGRILSFIKEIKDTLDLSGSDTTGNIEKSDINTTLSDHEK
ncbi:MAG TPA: hypothetical protein IAB39_04670 [Candidatus Onthovicinus excrementipullorum]|nr:hypothetical protein [Candidatus Onthovicinus excrementipullorum]